MSNISYPYKADKKGTITISKIEKIPGKTAADKTGINGILANFFAPKGYQKGQPSSLCKGGQPVDLSLSKNLDDKGESRIYLAQGEFDSPEVTQGYP